MTVLLHFYNDVHKDTLYFHVIIVSYSLYNGQAVCICNQYNYKYHHQFTWFSIKSSNLLSMYKINVCSDQQLTCMRTFASLHNVGIQPRNIIWWQDEHFHYSHSMYHRTVNILQFLVYIKIVIKKTPWWIWIFFVLFWRLHVWLSFIPCILWDPTTR